MQKKYLISGVVAGISIILLTAIILINSPWFLWHIIPQEGSIRISANTSLISPLAHVVREYNPAVVDITPYIIPARRIAYVRQGEEEVIVLAPKLTHFQEAREVLTNQGWHQLQWGLFLIGRREALNSNLIAKPSVSRTLSAFFASLNSVIKHIGNKTVAISQVRGGSIAGVTSDLAALTIYSKEGIYTKAELSTLDIPSFTPKDREEITKISSEERDVLALSSKMLAYIPNQKNELIGETLKNIGFSITVDKITIDASRFSSLLVTRNGNSQALGVKEDKTGFITQAKKWVGNEEGYNYPQKRAFKLPDGTLGYEMVPSKPTSGWTNTGDSCEYLTGKEKTWWICAGTDSAAISNIKQNAQDILSGVSNQYQILKIAKIREDQPQNRIKSVIAIIKEEEINLLIK
jgi:hypothetical protein